MLKSPSSALRVLTSVLGVWAFAGSAWGESSPSDPAAPPDLRQLPQAASAASTASRPAAPIASTSARPVLQAASTPQAVVIEDRFTRIEEMHERGEVRRITVQPKGGRPYEIVPATGGRDLSNSAGNGRAAAGQRVWPVLSF